MKKTHTVSPADDTTAADLTSDNIDNLVDDSLIMDDRIEKIQANDPYAGRQYAYLAFLVDRYYLMQEHRIATSNQTFALEGKSADTVEYFKGRFHEVEKEVAKYIAKEIKDIPIYRDYLKGIKGIGPIMAASLISSIDVRKAPHASSLWAYAGFSVDAEKGTCIKRQKGVKGNWNPFLKKTCWLIGKSFVKCGGPYREVYDTSKLFYQTKFPNEIRNGVALPRGEERKKTGEETDDRTVKYNKGHIDSLARRRVVKLFLSNLWQAWRELEGLEAGVPYAERIGVHKPRG